MEYIKCIAVLLYLIYESIWDIKKRKISFIGVIVMSLVGIILNILCGKFTFFRFLFGLLPGIFILLAALVTREKVGYGDGFVMIGLGMLLGGRDTFFVLLMGLFLCTIWSITFLIAGKMNRKSVLPFVPFLLVPGMAVFFLA